MSFEAALILSTSKHPNPIENHPYRQYQTNFVFTRLGKAMNIYTYDFGGIDSHGTIYGTSRK
jgi:hypothetical protein